MSGSAMGHGRSGAVARGSLPQTVEPIRIGRKGGYRLDGATAHRSSPLSVSVGEPNHGVV
eukprot:7934455-Pyramimonas_sp.AAC.1